MDLIVQVWPLHPGTWDLVHVIPFTSALRMALLAGALGRAQPIGSLQPLAW